MQSLRMALSSLPPASSPYHSTARLSSSAYKHFMQEPYQAADFFDCLQSDGANFPEWVALLSTQNFAMFKKLGIEAEELEGLLAQTLCHVPLTLDQAAFDQLSNVAILSKGNKRPSSTFVGQVILNASQSRPDMAQLPSPFVYWVSHPPELTLMYSWSKSPYYGFN
ncbi:hypothetical protein O181_013050 [Austropuccinia psidii MF-1]|uniref:Uncharacterized protein n=1 Tax=Austropuccinia psidii MF-1 TaxID=1389203 RepID=A0A9Q3GNI8_9BASI|nr:hypothetical protein [Austropuccinia psidii MF-1]